MNSLYPLSFIPFPAIPFPFTPITSRDVAVLRLYQLPTTNSIIQGSEMVLGAYCGGEVKDDS